MEWPYTISIIEPGRCNLIVLNLISHDLMWPWPGRAMQHARVTRDKSRHTRHWALGALRLYWFGNWHMAHLPKGKGKKQKLTVHIGLSLSRWATTEPPILYDRKSNPEDAPCQKEHGLGDLKLTLTVPPPWRLAPSPPSPTPALPFPCPSSCHFPCPFLFSLLVIVAWKISVASQNPAWHLINACQHGTTPLLDSWIEH